MINYFPNFTNEHREQSAESRMATAKLSAMHEFDKEYGAAKGEADQYRGQCVQARMNGTEPPALGSLSASAQRYVHDPAQYDKDRLIFRNKIDETITAADFESRDTGFKSGSIVALAADDNFNLDQTIYGDGAMLERIKASVQGTKSIQLYISSRGGEIVEGLAIFNHIQSHPGIVNIAIEGVAASMASCIAMAGNHVTITRNSAFMIHRARTIAGGDKNDFNQVSQGLETIDEALIDSYATRPGIKLTRNEIIQAMDAQTWYTAQQALDAGFVDEIIGATDNATSAIAGANLSAHYSNTPSWIG